MPPEVVAVPPPAAPVVRRPPEQWADVAARAGTPVPAWLLAGAFAHHRWERKFSLLSQAEFNAGLDTVANLSFGG